MLAAISSHITKLTRSRRRSFVTPSPPLHEWGTTGAHLSGTFS